MIYLKRKPYYLLFGEALKLEEFFAKKCYRQVLLAEVLFQLRGRGHPQSDATTNFFPDSKRTILGISNEVSFVSKLLLQKR